MKYSVLILVIVVLSGCSHREYINVHPQSKRDIDIDKEQCTYKAESSVPYSMAPLVRIDVHTKMSKEQRRAQENRQIQKRQREMMERDRKVKRLKDLCLKAKGWRWKYVDK